MSVQTRFLEEENKLLVQELRQLRLTWGQETQSLRTKFEPIIEELRRHLAESEQLNAETLVKIDSLESILQILRDRYEQFRCLFAHILI